MIKKIIVLLKYNFFCSFTCIAITDGALLEEGIDFEQLIVAG